MAPAPPWRMSAGLNVGVDVIICLFVESSGEAGVSGVIGRFRCCYTKVELEKTGIRCGTAQDHGKSCVEMVSAANQLLPNPQITR